MVEFEETDMCSHIYESHRFYFGLALGVLIGAIIVMVLL